MAGEVLWRVVGGSAVEVGFVCARGLLIYSYYATVLALPLLFLFLLDVMLVLSRAILLLKQGARERDPGQGVALTVLGLCGNEWKIGCAVRMINTITTIAFCPDQSQLPAMAASPEGLRQSSSHLYSLRQNYCRNGG